MSEDNIEERINYVGFTDTGLPYEIELGNSEKLAPKKELTVLLVDRSEGVGAATKYLAKDLFSLKGAVEYFKEIYHSCKEKIYNKHTIRKQHRDFDKNQGPPRSIAEVVYRDEKRIRVRGSCIIG